MSRQIEPSRTCPYWLGVIAMFAVCLNMPRSWEIVARDCPATPIMMQDVLDVGSPVANKRTAVADGAVVVKAAPGKESVDKTATVDSLVAGKVAVGTVAASAPRPRVVSRRASTRQEASPGATARSREVPLKRQPEPPRVAATALRAPSAGDAKVAATAEVESPALAEVERAPSVVLPELPSVADDPWPTGAPSQNDVAATETTEPVFVLRAPANVRESAGDVPTGGAGTSDFATSDVATGDVGKAVANASDRGNASGKPASVVDAKSAHDAVDSAGSMTIVANEDESPVTIFEPSPRSLTSSIDPPLVDELALVDDAPTADTWLESLAWECHTSQWAGDALALLRRVDGALSADGVEAVVETARRLSHDADRLARTTADERLAADIRRARHALLRATDAWRLAVAMQGGSADAWVRRRQRSGGQLASRLDAIDLTGSNERVAAAWREYLMLDVLAGMVRPTPFAPIENYRDVVEQTLVRLEGQGLSVRQRAYLSSQRFAAISADLKSLIAEPVEPHAFLAHVGRYERTRLPSRARLVARDLRNLGAPPTKRCNNSASEWRRTTAMPTCGLRRRVTSLPDCCRRFRHRTPRSTIAFSMPTCVVGSTPRRGCRSAWCPMPCG
ncbi:MAG: hypothetical protein R3C10_10400 [Pirellulales bacterium]